MPSSSFSIWVNPMALGIGAIIGPLFALLWFGGALFGYYILTPLGIRSGLFASMVEADLFRQNLGIGLMIGTGLGVFFKAVASRLTRQKKLEEGPRLVFNKRSLGVLVIIAFAVLLLALGTELGLVEAIVLMAGIYLATYLSGMLTGQTGINPMEILPSSCSWHQNISKPTIIASSPSPECRRACG